MLPMLDGDLTKIGVAHMKKMGMEFHLECPVQSVEPSPIGAKVVCRDKSGKTVSFEAEKVLVAIGRRANTESLHLDAGQIKNCLLYTSGFVPSKRRPRSASPRVCSRAIST